MSSAMEFLSAYAFIRDSNKILMQQIDAAISYEEHEKNRVEAIAAYEDCLRKIEDIFAIPVGLPDNVANVQLEWNETCKIIQKLKDLRTEVAYRLKVLRESPLNGTENMPKESTDKASASQDECKVTENKHLPKAQPETYLQVITDLRRVIGSKDYANQVNFDTLFQSPAKLYKIQSDGSAVTIAGNTSLSLVMCTTTTQNLFANLNGVCFIQCEITSSTAEACSNEPHLIWIYPLIPKVTNCCRTDYGALILPDLESEVPGVAFGIMLCLSQPRDSDKDAKEELADLETFFFDLLEAILAGIVEQLPQVRERDTSETISHHVVTAADFIARNLVKGAEKTGELMVRSTPYLISKINAAPEDVAPVSPALQTSVEVAKNVSSVAVGVTGWVAEKVGTASLALGRFMAPHIQRQGAAILQKGFGYDTAEANSKMEGVFTIAAGAVEGFATVYNGLDTSAKILGTNLSDNSVKIIEHSYGPSAGNVAAGTFDTIGNAFNVSQNVNYITPKGFAKKIAKNTGKAVVDDYKRKLRDESHFVSAGSLYPDLRSFKDQNQ